MKTLSNTSMFAALLDVWQVQEILHPAKSQEKFGRRRPFEENLQRCMSHERDMFIRHVGRSVRGFPEKCCILVHQIFRFAMMIVRDTCSTSYAWTPLCCCRRNTLVRWNGQIAKGIGAARAALHSSVHFCRKSRRIASSLTQ